MYPSQFSWFHEIIDPILQLLPAFGRWSLKRVHVLKNRVADEIARNVMRDVRLSSYVVHGGPSWLLQMLQNEAPRV